MNRSWIVRPTLAERQLYGDPAYWGELHRIAAKEHGVRYRVNRRPHPGRPLSEHRRKLNRLRRQPELVASMLSTW